MTPIDRYARVKDLFLRAIELPADERPAFVRSACVDDADASIADELLARFAEPSGSAGGADSVFSRGAVRFDVLPAHDASSVPDRVGAYAILDKSRPLGVGGMGVVYLAEQDRPRRNVALKPVRPGHLTPRLRRRFEFEAELLGKLEHPGIARVYEAGVVQTTLGEQPYFAMELVDGSKLGEHLAAQRPPASRDAKLRLIVKIARAVEHAHTRGVVHRDLKPDNVMITADGEPKVLDFGVAKATGADRPEALTMQTQSGQLIGTPAYMSPEQAAGRAEEVDAASDVYALGVIAYEMFAGGLPYALDGKPLHEVVRTICESEPARLSSVDRSLRGDVETVVGRCLENELVGRYASAGHLADEIERALNDVPIHARQSAIFYRCRKFTRRHRRLVVATAAIIASLTAGLVATAYSANRERVQRSAAGRSRSLAEERRVDAIEKVSDLAWQRGRFDEAFTLLGEVAAARPLRRLNR